MAFVDQKKKSRQTLSIAGVVLVHVAIGYAFVTGLAMRFIPRYYPPIVLLPPISKPEPPPPIDPPVRTPIPHPPLTPPIFDAGTEPSTGTIDPRTEIPDTKPEPSPPAKPITVYQRAVSVKGDRSTWVTTDDYPPESVRNGEEGRVEITVMVGTNGRVTSCEVTKPSGVSALDAATCRVYSRRARFNPALSSDGLPVAAPYVDRVRWQLPKD